MTEEKQQSVALARVQSQSGPMALQPSNYEGAIELAKQLSDSGLVPDTLKGKPKAILAIMVYGSEFRLPAMHSLQNIYVVKGRMSMSTNMMVGLILQSGLCEHFTCTATSETSATYATKRSGTPKDVELTFTIEQAKKAGYTTNPAWTNNPADMLRYRAASKLGRMVYPDVVSGVYTPQELRDDDFDAEVIDLTPEPEEQPIVQQKGETKADAFVREKKKEDAEQQTKDDIDEIFPPDEDDDEPEARDEESEAEPESGAEEQGEAEHFSVDQVDEINEILSEAFKGFGAERKNAKRLRVFEETDEFLSKNPTFLEETDGGYRNLHLVPAEHFEMVKAWAANVAQEIREEQE